MPLANEILPEARFHDRAREVARELASGQPRVFASINKVAREAASMKFQEAIDWITKRQFQTIDGLYDSEGNMEGFKAFTGKRDPA